MKRIPPRMRLMLITLAIIAVLSCTADAILLVVNSQRHRQNNLSATITASTAQPSAFDTPLVPIRGHGPISGKGTPTTSLAGTTPKAGSTSTAGIGNPRLMLSSSQLTFHYVQGNTQPISQSVILQSGDSSAFTWHIQGGSIPSWLTIEPLQGAISARNIGQIGVSVQVSQVPPGTYATALSISGTTGTGEPLQNSPQTLTVTLTVQPPCIFQAAPTTLTFTSSLLQPNPPGQTLTMNTSGNCAASVNWTASTDAAWVQLSSSSGIDTGSGSSISVTIHARGMLVGTYTAHIALVATDSNGAAVPVKPQSITVTLNVTA
ncbi:MAG TPA: hypothetical protein VKT25_14300 [Ktedonobacteraceae bacterium]|nr:hypothetical protein [Ktedonobacteraceae bacterium]